MYIYCLLAHHKHPPSGLNTQRELLPIFFFTRFTTRHDVPQNREQDLGGLKGLSLEGTPTSRGSLEAFCRQKRLRSDAACDTCAGEEKLRY